MTTINRATWTDDDGSGTTGTILNNARLQGDIYDKVDGALATLDAKDVSQDSAITANGPHSILSAQHPDTTPAGLVAGDLLVATGAPPKLARLAKGADGTLLGVVAGAPVWAAPTAGLWTAVPYSAANFSAAAGTWTITAGNIAAYQYTVIGKTLIVSFNVGPSTTSAATGNVRFALPTGIVQATTSLTAATSVGGAIWLPALATAAAGGNLVLVYNNVSSNMIGAWPASTTIYIALTITVPLQ